MKTDTDRWVPIHGETKLVYNVPLEGGGYVKETLIASKIVDRSDTKLGSLVIATNQKDGSIHIIGSDLIIKRLKSEQNLKYGTIRWSKK